MGALHSSLVSLVGETNIGDFQAASRTDAGVHALQNVVHVDVRRLRGQVGPEGAEPFSAERLRLALNAGLRSLEYAKNFTQVEAATRVPNSWHCRRHLAYKTYIYRLAFPRQGSAVSPAMQAEPPLFSMPYCYFVREPLDVSAMQRATRHLVGTRDFSALRGSGCTSITSIKSLFQVDVQPDDCNSFHDSPAVQEVAGQLNGASGIPQRYEAAQASSFLHGFLPLPNCRARPEFGSFQQYSQRAPLLASCSLVVRGNAFMYQMVRNMAGLLVQVGRGKIQPDAVPDVLAMQQRVKLNFVPCAPPQGLFLAEVKYQDEVALPRSAAPAVADADTGVGIQPACEMVIPAVCGSESFDAERVTGELPAEDPLLPER
jgi:tRNA pseudouridine38-40 synthase